MEKKKKLFIGRETVSESKMLQQSHISTKKDNKSSQIRVPKNVETALEPTELLLHVRKHEKVPVRRECHTNMETNLILHLKVSAAKLHQYAQQQEVLKRRRPQEELFHGMSDNFESNEHGMYTYNPVFTEPSPFQQQDESMTEFNPFHATCLHPVDEATESNTRRMSASCPKDESPSCVLHCGGGMDTSMDPAPSTRANDQGRECVDDIIIQDAVKDDDSCFCWHCCHSFTGFIFEMPIRRVDRKLHVTGSFCCPECVVAFIFNGEEHTSVQTSMKRHAWLHEMYQRKLLDDDCMKQIHPAPGRNTLKRFGGELSIEEFRDIARKYDTCTYQVTRPFLPISGFKDQITIGFNYAKETQSVTNQRLTDVSAKLKLIREENPLRKTTLDQFMNITTHRRPDPPSKIAAGAKSKATNKKK